MNKIAGTILMVCIFLTACDNDDTKNTEEFTRTLIVYLGRDNNLAGSSEDKLSAIMQGWDGKGGNLIVYQDIKNNEPALYELYKENEETKLLTIETYPEENSADPAVLARVIQDVKGMYPADSYGLVFFSHATGWLPEGVFETTRSIGMDGSSEMDLVAFAAAIPDKMFDFIIFEACFTAGIEMAYELKDKTNYLLGSSAEIVSPGFHSIYQNYIHTLFYKEADLAEFAKQAFEWVDAKTGDYRSGTLSLIRTSPLQTLASWIKQNADYEQAVTTATIQPFDRKQTHLFFDFQDYYNSLIPSGKQAELASLINDCIVYKAATPLFFSGVRGFTIDKHSGLTTYIMQENLPDLNTAYQRLKWYKEAY